MSTVTIPTWRVYTNMGHHDIQASNFKTLEEYLTLTPSWKLGFEFDTISRVELVKEV